MMANGSYDGKNYGDYDGDSYIEVQGPLGPQLLAHLGACLVTNTPPFDSCGDCNFGVFPSEMLFAANFSSKLGQKLKIYIYRN